MRYRGAENVFLGVMQEACNWTCKFWNLLSLNSSALWHELSSSWGLGSAWSPKQMHRPCFSPDLAGAVGSWLGSCCLFTEKALGAVLPVIWSSPPAKCSFFFLVLDSKPNVSGPDPESQCSLQSSDDDYAVCCWEVKSFLLLFTSVLSHVRAC